MDFGVGLVHHNIEPLKIRLNNGDNREINDKYILIFSFYAKDFRLEM